MFNNFVTSFVIAIIVELVALLISKLREKKPVFIIGSLVAIVIAFSPLISLPTSPYIKIINNLALPINIYIDGSKTGRVQSQQEKTIIIDKYPVEVRWDIVRLKNKDTAYLSDTYSSVQNGETITVNNSIGGQEYFFINLSNHTSDPCRIVINDGYLGSINVGMLQARKKNIVAGYFPLEFYSNVTLYCESKTYWWGYRPYKDRVTDTLVKLVEPNSGILQRIIP